MSAEAKVSLVLAAEKFEAGIKKATESLEGFHEKVGEIAKIGLALGGLTAAAFSVEGAFENLKEAMEVGAHLQNLSAQTGIAVDSLAVLSQAFANADLGADSVAPAVNRLQKALSGINEDGQETASAFSKIGLSVSSLKALTPEAQFAAVGRAISSITDPADRTAAAISIFGKSGAAMLALFRNGGAITVAGEQVGAQAGILKGNAEAFDKIAGSLNSAGLKLQGFYVGAASELAPLLENFADSFNKLDLSPLGKGVGEQVAAAFKSDSTSEALADLGGRFVRVMVAAAESIANIIGAVLTKGFEDPIAGLQSRIESITEKLYVAFNGTEGDQGMRAASHVQGDIDSYQEKLDDIEARKPGSGYRTWLGIPDELSQSRYDEQRASLLADIQSAKELQKKDLAYANDPKNGGHVQFDAANEDLADRKAEILTRGVRTGLGDGLTASERIDGALDSFKKAAYVNLNASFAPALGTLLERYSPVNLLGRGFLRLPGDPEGRLPASPFPQRVDHGAEAVARWQQGLEVATAAWREKIDKIPSIMAVSALASVGGGGRVGWVDPILSEAKKQTRIIEREEQKRTAAHKAALANGIIRVVPTFGTGG